MTTSRCPRCGAERTDPAMPCPVCAFPRRDPVGDTAVRPRTPPPGPPGPPPPGPPPSFWPSAPPPPGRPRSSRRTPVLVLLAALLVTGVVVAGLVWGPDLLGGDDEPGAGGAGPAASASPSTSPPATPTPTPTPTPTTTPTPGTPPSRPRRDLAAERAQARRTALQGLQAWARVQAGEARACRGAVRATVLPGSGPLRRCGADLGTRPGLDLRLRVLDVELGRREGTATVRFRDRSAGGGAGSGRRDYPLVRRQGRWLLDFRETAG